MTKTYSEAAVEVLDILDHTDPKKVKLIPVKFINYLKENAASNYSANLDYSKPINEMNIKSETKAILGTISRKWWWNENQKNEYKKLVKEKEIKRQEKYSVNNIFQNKKLDYHGETIKQENATNEVVTANQFNESSFQKIIGKIKSIFK